MLRSTTPPGVELFTPAQRRPRISAELKARLENAYQQNPKPTRQIKKQLAEKFQMTESNVHFWFQNRRSKRGKVLSDNVSTNKVKAKYNKAVESQDVPTAFQRRSFVPPSSSGMSSAFHRLPPISTIFVSNCSWPETHTSYIVPYFHHEPFGMEATYVQWCASRDIV
ncbi:hypothetical protein DM01DRAFT_1410126 [Hesseltinella vesiculosa]|uniref:Homeobox domain-containing protein n=1 Tax=Hesseltinella vesiculosa TaxID=101127 RepID=A0A1X2G8L8_9FUNG|nr:hypothetical protein DM01DRAFT_1410126 [Hesseltinella vesiculosa]